MDEHQTTLQSNCSDAASDDLSNSILGKMKCSVSKILPNSISKWLSPKVDVQNSRRRRHDELDSEEEETEQNRSLAFGNISSSLVSRNNNYTQRVAATLTTAPPNKRQRIFTPSPFPTYSTALAMLPRRDSIISSTLIEDTAAPTLYRPYENGTELHRRSSDRIAAHDNSNQIRSSPLITASAELRSSINDLNFQPSVPFTRSQPTALPTYRAERDLDETSSNRSTNPFALNNDSMAVNFSAHLQKSKSLFSNKSYVSPSSRSLSNYRMRRQPNSSLYRSTSSLCDNNSNASSNASSVLSSPFYIGQTTFGGASAQSKRFASGFQSQPHRAKIPSRLVPSNLSKSTSSLNVSDSNTMSGVSSTAKRILDIMNQSSTPLGDVRRISSALPTTTATTSSNRRLSSLLEVSETGSNDIDKMKRKLLKPNTPYNRPVGRSVTEPYFTQSLNVPSMPQLLQLKKKLTNNTIKGRELASNSNSILNKPPDDYKLPEIGASSDLDATNNNHKSTPNNKHVSKIRKNIFPKQRKGSKLQEHEMPPEPIDLPNVQLIVKNADIVLPMKAFPAPKAPTIETRKMDEPIAKPKTVDAPAITFTFTPAPLATPKTSESVPLAAIATTSAQTNNSNTKSIFSMKSVAPSPDEQISAAKKVSTTNDVSYEFASPIYVKRAATKTDETDKFNVQKKENYKFSQPIVINSTIRNAFASTATTTPSTSTTNVTPSTSFGSKKVESSGQFSFAKQVPSTGSIATTKSVDRDKCDNTLKALAAKQTQNKWSCSSCFTPNENLASKCVCCGVSHSSTAAAASSVTKATISSSSGATAIVDDVFKSIATKQKQSKWVCDACMTGNDVSQTKCVCCGDNKPGSATPSSASSSSLNAQSKVDDLFKSKVDDLFKSIAAKQKSSTWTCSVCDTKNDMNKSKCVCCQQAKESDTAAATSSSDTAKSVSGKFSFGSGGIDLGASSGKFTFGSKAVAETTSAATSMTQATPQFTFGYSKPADDKIKSAASSITFGSYKTDNTSAAAATPTFSFGSTSTETKPMLPLGTFAFGGAAPKIDSTITSTSSSSSSSSSSTISTTSSAAAGTTTSSALFAFGSPAVTTAKAQTSSISEPNVTDTTTAPVVDDIFKKIVSQQTAKWSCSSCMAQNNQTDSECVCCNTPKDGTSSSENKGKIESAVKSQFSFGSPATSTFSFGLKPAAEKTSTFQFGAATPPAVTSSNAVTSTSSTFSLASAQSPFASPFASQKTNIVSIAGTSTGTTSATKPFQFGFGAAAPTFGSPKFGSPTVASSDVTDTTTTTAASTTANILSEKKNVTVLDNVLIKPPAPIEQPKPTFSFGATNTPEDKSKSLKRPNSDVSNEPNLFKTPTLTATAPAVLTSFVFGQSNSTTNPLGSTSSNHVPNSLLGCAVTSATSAPTPTFSFGTNSSSQSATPAFGGFNSAPILQFGALPTTMNTTPSAPVFGSGHFPSASPSSTTSNLAQNTFKPSAFSFGNPAPSFGNSVQNPAPTEQPAQQPQTNLFQFGAASPKDAFCFSANATPSFNFSATPQSQTETNAPFQFSQGAPTNNLFAPQSSNAAIQQRRKLRPVRRTNRP